MNQAVSSHLSQIEHICESHQVNYLYAFGSVVNENFKQGKSDIDFAVEFSSKVPILQISKKYFSLIRTLEELLQSKVELVSYKVVRNQIFKEELDRTKVAIYEAKEPQ